MDKEQCVNYLYDLAVLLKEKAFEAKGSKENDSAGKDYNLGRSMAFYEVISLMQQQAQAFGIPLNEIALADINPDRDLL